MLPLRILDRRTIKVGFLQNPLDNADVQREKPPLNLDPFCGCATPGPLLLILVPQAW